MRLSIGFDVLESASRLATAFAVSQSVPHFHVHIVPRRKGDGLRGFMWPRHKYATTAEADAISKKIRGEVARLIEAE